MAQSLAMVLSDTASTAGVKESTDKGNPKTQSNSKGKARQLSNTTSSSTGVFRFQDLPGELRNNIYSICLVANGPITISRPVDRVAMAQPKDSKVKGEGKDGTNILLHKLQATVRKTTGKRPRKCFFKNRHTISLLEVDRAIHGEARPLLYARNKFVFECPKAFYDFHSYAHNAFRFLEDLEFVDFPVPKTLNVPLICSTRLSRVAVKVKSNYLQRHTLGSAPRIFSWISNLVLRCACNSCQPSNPLTSLSSAVPQMCILESSTAWKHRLDTVSFRMSDFEVFFKDGVAQTNDLSSYEGPQMRDLMNMILQTHFKSLLVAEAKHYSK